MLSKDIVIVGVGGQGTLLASRVLGALGLQLGCDVKVSEVHGMSQRGGSVITYVRLGERVASPIIERGQADIVIAFEELEAYRALPYLKENGTLIVNTQKIMPMPVITGAAEYPKEIIETLKSKNIHLVTADALPLAQQAGSIKAVNTVMLGVLAAKMEPPKAIWLDIIKNTVPQKTVDINLAAFELGYKTGGGNDLE